MILKDLKTKLSVEKRNRSSFRSTGKIEDCLGSYLLLGVRRVHSTQCGSLPNQPSSLIKEALVRRHERPGMRGRARQVRAEAVDAEEGWAAAEGAAEGAGAGAAAAEERGVGLGKADLLAQVGCISVVH